MHIIEPPGIWFLQPNLMRRIRRVQFIPHVIAICIIAITVDGRCTRTTRIFPLRLCRQVKINTRLCPQPPQERSLVNLVSRRPFRAIERTSNHAIGNIVDRIVVTNPIRCRGTRIRPHHEFPLLLRDLIKPHVKWFREHNRMRLIITLARIAHDECSRIHTLQHKHCSLE